MRTSMLWRNLWVRACGQSDAHGTVGNAGAFAMDLKEAKQERLVLADPSFQKERVRGAMRRFAARAGKIEDDGYEDQSLAYQQTLQLLLAAQRDALLKMRSDGDFSSEVMNRVLRELDLEESRLEI